MTTKRKAILKAIALASLATIDDLVTATGLERKNLHDNIKATIKEDLCERQRDDVTGLPAYKLTAKGRAWLENDKDNSSGVKPQPAVGENTGSKDTGSAVGSGSTRTDPLPVGNAVKAPPKPDKKPVAASADEIKDAQRNADLEVRLDSAGRSIVEFCEWLAKKANMRCPMNLHECKAAVMDLMQASELVAEYEEIALAQARTIKELHAEIDDGHKRIATLESNAELPIDASAWKREQNLLIALDLATSEKDRLHAENVALKTLNETMPGFGAAYEAQKAKKPAQPRRPFSVTGLSGYHAGGEKVTLFLDRRLNARSITLPAEKLAQLAEMAAG